MKAKRIVKDETDYEILQQLSFIKAMIGDMQFKLLLKDRKRK